MKLNTGRVTRRYFLIAGAAVAASGPAQAQTDWWSRARRVVEDAIGGPTAVDGLTSEDAAAGLREALRVGVTRTIERVGAPDGYFADPEIHIPLPGFLGQVRDFTARIGASGLLDDLELRLNRAAETAAPVAQSIFFDAIGAMTIDDAIEIVRGPDDAATRYFEGRMTPPLRDSFRPIVEDELERSGAMQVYDTLEGRLSRLPVTPPLGAEAKGRLATHGLDYALAGVFHYLAREEAEIRANPARRTTEILEKVFG